MRVNSSGPAILSESDLLISKNPSSSDDLWPEFTLSNVEVHDPRDEHRLASLFTAGTDCPLTLIGRLDRVPRDLQSLLINKRSLPASIRIQNVEYFAYGQREDGDSAIWAAGDAGWYLIRPSRTYKDIYHGMIEATNALYFATDFYQARKDKRSLEQHPVRELFREYSQDPLYSCADVDTAELVFAKHRFFLLDIMDKPPKRSDIKWKKTPLYNFLVQYEEDSDPIGGMDGAVDDFDMDLSDEEEHTPIKGRGKSSLRPRSGKYSLKAAGRRRSLAEIVDEEMRDTPVKRSRHEGRVLRSRRPTKYTEDPNEEPSTSKSEENEWPSRETTAVKETVSLPFGRARPTPGQSEDMFNRLEVKEEQMPSHTANAPGDVWRCPFDGCSHLVYAASEPKARGFIEDHYRNHAYQSQAQIDLVQQEAKPYLPVSNLLKKLREVAASHPNIVAGAESQDQKNWPKPIRQRY